ncbi:MAG: hypothetical protein H0U59_03910 [Gemmatimonadaceae bacterium]|nr:hypothetical protein [Gemmatimonadaceae bacterium]
MGTVEAALLPAECRAPPRASIAAESTISAEAVVERARVASDGARAGRRRVAAVEAERAHIAGRVVAVAAVVLVLAGTVGAVGTRRALAVAGTAAVAPRRS